MLEPEAAASAETTTKTESTVQPLPGLLVTAELEKAIEECKKKVARIAKACRASNKKFRDVEFDLENDQYRCLHGLDFPVTGKYTPSDVQRVTQIFEHPQFFVNGADSNDIIQGKIGDCWFLSALATVSTAKGLVEKFCVARDEEVGVYGFIFFRDNGWVNVVVDDMLYTSVPKYEELTAAEKELYHDDKVKFNNSARKGGKTLYFAKSGTTGETWVPLIEKAYAKLHGDYVSLSGGKASEAVEDITGGVSTLMRSKDILDKDRYWNEELLKANKDRVFGCSFDALNSSRSGLRDVRVDGLIGSHAYSVLRAVECKGKRFVVLRNPWGRSEWSGRWSDGSKEWTAEWLEILPQLQHEFGDDGQFVMEYDDFLDSWEQIHRTIIFDSSWVMSSHWLEVQVKPLPSAWSHGDVSFTFSLPKHTFAIIVLSQLDTRYFTEIASIASWTLEFTLAKRGESDPIADATPMLLYSRSVNLEIDLEAGEYVVYVRLDRTNFKEPDYFKKGVDSGWDHRKLSRILTERAKSRSIASNFTPGIQTKYLPTELSELIDCDLAEYKKQKDAENSTREESEDDGTITVTTVTTTTTTKTEKIVKKKNGQEPPPAQSKGEATNNLPPSDPLPRTTEAQGVDSCQIDPGHVPHRSVSPLPSSSPLPPPPPPPANNNVPSNNIEICENENLVYLGLRVYTNNEAPAKVGGKLRGEMHSPEEQRMSRSRVRGQDRSRSPGPRR